MGLTSVTVKVDGLIRYPWTSPLNLDQSNFNEVLEKYYPGSNYFSPQVKAHLREDFLTYGIGLLRQYYRFKGIHPRFNKNQLKEMFYDVLMPLWFRIMYQERNKVEGFEGWGG